MRAQSLETTNGHVLPPCGAAGAAQKLTTQEALRLVRAGGAVPATGGETTEAHHGR